MLKVSILVTTDDGDGEDQKLIGSFLLRPGEAVPRIEAPNEDGRAVMRNILAAGSSRGIYMKGGNVYVSRDPEAWMRALPYHYNGSMMRASLEELAG